MLELINLRKAFNPGTINEKKALNGVTIKLEEGDFVTIIGGNGAGKSTTLNAIAGVWPVDEGAILINGQNVTGLSEHQRAKYIGRGQHEAARRGRFPHGEKRFCPRQSGHHDNRGAPEAGEVHSGYAAAAGGGAPLRYLTGERQGYHRGGAGACRRGHRHSGGGTAGKCEVKRTL